MTTISDSFDRANETPIASPWSVPSTGESAFNLSSNVAVPVNPASSDGTAIYTGATWGADQSSKGKLSAVGTGGGGQGIGLVVRRAVAVRTGYRFVLDHGTPNNAEIRRFVAGASAVLATWTVSWTDGDEFEFRIIGPQTAALLTVYQNGTLIQAPAADNSTVATGFPGLASSSTFTSGSVNDWTGTDNFGGGVTRPSFNPLPFMR